MRLAQISSYCKELKGHTMQHHALLSHSCMWRCSTIFTSSTYLVFPLEPPHQNYPSAAPEPCTAIKRKYHTKRYNIMHYFRKVMGTSTKQTLAINFGIHFNSCLSSSRVILKDMQRSHKLIAVKQVYKHVQPQPIV